MNEFDDALQERLERLEAGESLASCQTGLSAEDADLLRLAVQLQKMEAPIPAQASLMAQRAALLAAVPTPPPAAKSEQAGFLALLASFFNSPVRIGGAIALAVVVLVAIGLWANRPATEPGFTQDLNGGKTAVSPESISPNETNPTEAAQVAAIVPANQPTPANTTFLPMLSIALPAAPNLATLTAIQGLVEVQEADGSWQSVLSPKSLPVGSQIRTGALSSASLAFFDNSVAALGPETGLTIEQLDAQQPENGFRTVVLKQWQGESSHAVHFRNDGGSRYEVLTPDGSGLARGTKFKVNVTPEQFSSFAVTEGQVDVTASSQTVSVTAGKSSTIPVNAPPTTPAFIITGQGELSAIGDTWIIAGQAFVVNESSSAAI
jgi:mannose-6-phosphate isomerase-like protein (cupin superfamily)